MNIEIREVILWGLEIAAVLAALQVITAKNTVYAVLGLVCAFASVAGIILMIGVEYLSILYVIVYMGAIAILMMFTVMMLNIRVEELRENSTRYIPVGLLIGVMFILEVSNNLKTGDQSALIQGLDRPVETLYGLSSISRVGEVLYTTYWPHLIIGSMVLILSMVGAIALTITSTEGEVTKRQDIFSQVATDTSRAILLTKGK